MSKDIKTLVLLDAHASMLMKIVTDLKPDYIVACYDLPGKTFRHEAYDAYKAGRAKTDDALIVQLKNSRAIFEAFNVPIYDAKGFEADDVLGTICEKYKKDQNLKIIIASGDMDAMQLLDDKKVQVYTLKKGINDTILYDEDAIVNRFGFKPNLLPDYKGLRGDASDNIIGIKGIGEKTATILIKNFGSIEEIYKKLKKDSELFSDAGCSPRVIELLKNNEEEAMFSKTLAKIRTDAPIDFSIPSKTFWENADLKKIEKVFALFEFRSLFGRLKNFFSSQKTQEKNVLLNVSSPKIDSIKLQEASIALWLINSEISNPQLDDILMFAGADSFDVAYEYIFKKLELARFTFANPTGAEIKVTNLAFNRIGVSNDSTMTNVYLYNGAVRITDSAGVSNTAFNFNDATGLFTVPAGGIYTVSVRSDLADSTSGEQIGVKLTAVTSSGTLDSSVSLPVTGGLQTVSSA